MELIYKRKPLNILGAKRTLGMKNKIKNTLVWEKHFVQNYTRDKTDRYIVLKMDPTTLGNSKQIAMKKFIYL